MHPELKSSTSTSSSSSVLGHTSTSSSSTHPGSAASKVLSSSSANNKAHSTTSVAPTPPGHTSSSSPPPPPLPPLPASVTNPRQNVFSSPSLLSPKPNNPLVPPVGTPHVNPTVTTPIPPLTSGGAPPMTGAVNQDSMGIVNKALEAGKLGMDWMASHKALTAVGMSTVGGGAAAFASRGPDQKTTEKEKQSNQAIGTPAGESNLSPVNQSPEATTPSTNTPSSDTTDGATPLLNPSTQASSFQPRVRSNDQPQVLGAITSPQGTTSVPGQGALHSPTQGASTPSQSLPKGTNEAPGKNGPPSSSLDTSKQTPEKVNGQHDKEHGTGDLKGQDGPRSSTGDLNEADNKKETTETPNDPNDKRKQNEDENKDHQRRTEDQSLNHKDQEVPQQPHPATELLTALITSAGGIFGAAQEKELEGGKAREGGEDETEDVTTEAEKEKRKGSLKEPLEGSSLLSDAEFQDETPSSSTSSETPASTETTSLSNPTQSQEIKEAIPTTSSSSSSLTAMASPTPLPSSTPDSLIERQSVLFSPV